MLNKRYFIIDAQKIYAASGKSTRILTNDEKLNLVKFIVRDTCAKLKHDDVVSHRTMTTPDKLFLDSFVVDKSTRFYVNRRSYYYDSDRRDLKKVVKDQMECLQKANSHQAENSYYSKYISISNGPNPKELGLEIPLDHIPFYEGKVILICNTIDGEDNLTIQFALLRAFNFNYQDPANCKNAMVMHWY